MDSLLILRGTNIADLYSLHDLANTFLVNRGLILLRGFLLLHQMLYSATDGLRKHYY